MRARVVFVIRHAMPTGSRHNQAAFGPQGGPLTEAGVQQAKSLTLRLQEFGIDVTTEPVATSFAKRAYETAKYAGFRRIQKYASLGEVGGDLSPAVLDALIAAKQVPPAAVAAAHALLAQPPQERVWVTHGQLIAGIAYVLRIPPTELFIPPMGSLTKLSLP
ncbi:MAG TPA: phosphoglycerate mutase family protein [Candidatus Saccharimonadales bacterium]|nr:phosphoglycerate mutase family protein [Candidatus Saccharimonadales bacterium]